MRWPPLSAAYSSHPWKTAHVRVLQVGDLNRLGIARFYHPELDVLRFFAFLLVFIHHTIPHSASVLNVRMSQGLNRAIAEALAGFSLAGGFGVDVFFTLSAYLITELLLRERERFGRLDVRSFYLRRILRIWPLYYSFLFLGVASSSWLSGERVPWRTVFCFAFLAGNWVGWPAAVIGPLWSVSVEEQFYLAWPPVLSRLNKRGLLIFGVCMMAVASLTQLIMLFNNTGEFRIGCNTLARLDSIVLGIITAVLLDGRAPKFASSLRVLLFGAGIAALLLAACYLGTRENPPHFVGILLGYPLVALGSVSMLLATLSERPPWFARGPLVYLGRVSYGLYVYHTLALLLVKKAWRAPVILRLPHQLSSAPARLVCGLLLTVIFAALSFHLLEKPFLQMKERLAKVPSRPGG